MPHSIHPWNGIFSSIEKIRDGRILISCKVIQICGFINPIYNFGLCRNLDTEVSESDVIEQKKQYAHSKIDQLDPEQLQKTLESRSFREHLFQRVVGGEEVEQLISEGWRYVGTLPNGKIMVKN